MERYVIFIRKMDTGEEFVSAHKGPANAHTTVMAAAKQKYPEPAYMVHTAYTETELADVLESMNRWCGPAETTQTINKAETIFSN